MTSLAQPQMIYKLSDTYAPYPDPEAPPPSYPTYPPPTFDYLASHPQPVDSASALFTPAPGAYLALQSVSLPVSASGGTSMSSAGSLEHLSTPPTPMGMGMATGMGMGMGMGAAMAAGGSHYGAPSQSHSHINGWAPQPQPQPVQGQAGPSYLPQAYDSAGAYAGPVPPQHSGMPPLPPGATQILMVDGHALPADSLGRVIGIEQLPPALQARLAGPPFSHGMQAQAQAAGSGFPPQRPHPPATATAQGAGMGQLQAVMPDMAWNGAEVKHRRRTSPHQLQVLERFFAVNPKPDGQVREYLGELLGMSKRNVQVWFQNRRAKLKNQHLKEAEQREQLAKQPKGMHGVAEEASGDDDEKEDADDGADGSGGESVGHPSRPSTSRNTSSGTDGLGAARPDEPIVISALPGQTGRPEVPQLHVQVHHNPPTVLSPMSVSPPQDGSGNPNALGISHQMAVVSSSPGPGPSSAMYNPTTPSPQMQAHVPPQSARPTVTRTGSGLLPPSFNPNLRRVSLANGDIPRLGAIMARRQSQAGSGTPSSPTAASVRLPASPSSSRRPSLGYKGMAHPYAPPADAGSLASMGAGGRRMSTTLHQHAMRNELVMRSATTGGGGAAAAGRRASMPFVQPLGMSSSLSESGGPGGGAGAQLISSNVFSVPRTRRTVPGQPGYLLSGGSASGGGSQSSSVSPQGTVPDGMDGQAGSGGPLPNPGFSFGSIPQSQSQASAQAPPMPQTGAAYPDMYAEYNLPQPPPQPQSQPQQADISALDAHMWTIMQARGRLGSLASLASIGSAYTTDGDAGSGTESIGWGGMGLAHGHGHGGGGQGTVEWPGFEGALGGEESEILRALEGMLSSGGGGGGQAQGQGLGQPGEVQS